MGIGFVTGYSEERVQFAGKAGFDCLEVVLWEDMISEEKAKEIKGVLDTNKVRAGTIAGYMNHLHVDVKTREQNMARFIKMLKLCKLFGTNIVTTNAESDRTTPVKDNLKIYKEVFTEYAKVAEKENVKIGIENCPHIGGYPQTIGNIAYAPEMWSLMFETVPSKSIGLEFDPSHLFWLGVDYVRAAAEFGDRIYAVHAKDTEILKDNLARRSIVGDGWWRYRIPGWGDINWQKFMAALFEHGYKGDLIIEHEDPVFGGERTDEGLKLGLRYLRQFYV